MTYSEQRRRREYEQHRDNAYRERIGMSYQEYKARQERELRKAAEQRERDRQIEAERAAGIKRTVDLIKKIARIDDNVAADEQLDRIVDEATKPTYAERLAAWNAPELERQRKRQQHRQD